MTLALADLALLAAAPAVGSFVGLAAHRFGTGETIVWGRSRCRACGHGLSAVELVPVAGWLAQGGRCRSCGAPIGFWYPALELAALGIAAWAVAVLPGWHGWLGALLGWTLLALAALDLRTMVLPNVLTLPLAAAGLAFAAAAAAYPLDHLVGALVGYAAFAAIGRAWERTTGHEALGLGDAKLFAAAGAWVGWQGLPSVLLIASVAGLGLALLRTRLGHGLHAPLPFGPALAAGFWITWAHGPLQLG
ncbi:MAG TPA: A24 family peptidase [Thermohalobaculum sp.]|nr:A24 family peptidase [Thermohalobaculum sp.]